MFKRKTSFLIYYFLYVIVIIFFVDYAFYLCYKNKIMPAKLMNKRLSSLELKVGLVQGDKKSSYINFEKDKKAGIVRIGCFGDSLTHGDEVNDIFDYPSVLQDIFDNAGYKNIEVLNFGTGGYGFQQAFILWEYLGKEYNLDYILLGPEGFHYERDRTFNWQFQRGYNDVRFDSFHSRYILENNGEARLVDSIGVTHIERVRNYWRFIPRFRYLRFEWEPPMFLISPLACLSQNKKLKRNPFYYKNDVNKELDDIYKILLNRMCDSTSYVILGHSSKGIVNLGKDIKRNNFFAAQIDKPFHFPYVAFANHCSPCGNKAVAQQFFDLIANKPETTLTMLRVKDIDEQPMSNSLIMKKICEYKDIAIEINNVKVGRFYNIDFSEVDICDPPYCTPVKNSLEGAASLLALKSKGANITDALFVPLNFEVKENMPLLMRIKAQGRIIDYPLGNVKVLDAGLNFGIAVLPSYRFDRDNRIIEFEVEENSIFLKDSFVLKKHNNFTILLKDNPIISGVIVKDIDGKIKLTVVDNRFLIIRADGREMLNVEGLSPEGVAYLSLYKEGQKEPTRIPIATWFKATKKVFFDR